MFFDLKNFLGSGNVCARFINSKVFFEDAVKRGQNYGAEILEPKSLGELRMYSHWLANMKWTAGHVFLNYNDAKHPGLFVSNKDGSSLPFENAWAEGTFFQLFFEKFCDTLV